MMRVSLYDEVRPSAVFPRPAGVETGTNKTSASPHPTTDRANRTLHAAVGIEAAPSTAVRFFPSLPFLLLMYSPVACKHASADRFVSSPL